jgi:hypothetical protein
MKACPRRRLASRDARTGASRPPATAAPLGIDSAPLDLAAVDVADLELSNHYPWPAIKDDSPPPGGRMFVLQTA